MASLRKDHAVDLGLGAAGLISVVLGLAHEVVGVVAALPVLTEDRLPGTRIGPSSLTIAMLRVSWHLVGVFVLGLGGVLLTIAVADGTDPRTVVLRWVAAMWAGATVIGFWSVRHRPRNLLRLPVPFTWPVIALLCWKASS